MGFCKNALYNSSAYNLRGNSRCSSSCQSSAYSATNPWRKQSKAQRDNGNNVCHAVGVATKLRVEIRSPVRAKLHSKVCAAMTRICSLPYIAAGVGHVVVLVDRLAGLFVTPISFFPNRNFCKMQRGRVFWRVTYINWSYVFFIDIITARL